jgi:outer membrane protein assembly factor BamD (BamD/ComL family)
MQSSLPLARWLLALLAMAGCQGLHGGLHTPRHAARTDALPSGTMRAQSSGLPRPVGTYQSLQGNKRSRNPKEEEPTPVENLWRRIKQVWTGPPDETKAQDLFQQADEQFTQRNYAAARKLYESAAGAYPDSQVEEDALFMVAECYFFEDRYPKAEEAYGALLEKYGQTRHLDTVTRRLFSIARYWQDLQQADPRWPVNPNVTDKSRPLFDTAGHALKTLETVWLKDPTGPLADRAVMQIANTHFLAGRWADADHYYTTLRQDFPHSRYLVQAYILGYRAKMEKYQGPQYDRAPLDEAEELIETLLTQFPDKLGDERLQVEQARAAVRAQQAEREWIMGEYYARNHQHRAARFYFQQVVERYPDTRFAESARSRLQEIAGQPDKPPQRLAWLDRVIPSKRSGPQPIAGGELR